MAYLHGRGELFDERIAQGLIRDGHGDLLADDIFCLDDGPRILDCLAFSDDLRCGDVVADLSFLVMDLQRLGAAEAGRALLRAYCEFSDFIFTGPRFGSPWWAFRVPGSRRSPNTCLTSSDGRCCRRTRSAETSDCATRTFASRRPTTTKPWPASTRRCGAGPIDWWRRPHTRGDRVRPRLVTWPAPSDLCGLGRPVHQNRTIGQGRHRAGRGSQGEGAKVGEPAGTENDQVGVDASGSGEDLPMR